VLGYCLMTNHIHLVARPEQADSLAILLRRVHGRYAQHLNVKKQRVGHLWQNRYYSCPLSESHLWVAFRYVEQNPVRAGLAAQPEQYRWSSARAHRTGVDLSGILDLDFWREAGGERFELLHATPEAEVQSRLQCRCTYAGRPFRDGALSPASSRPFNAPGAAGIRNSHPQRQPQHPKGAEGDGADWHFHSFCHCRRSGRPFCEPD
jgi:putative transposase